VAWTKVLELLVVNRLIDPGSEFRVHHHWFDQSAMDVLLGVDFQVAEKDRLYRCLDRLLEHRQDLFVHLQQRWRQLFDAQFDLVLYDLTSTYVEGEAEQNPKAKRGYSRDGRPDCKQVVIALVITPEGFPLAYEVMDGNTSDKTTLRGFLDKIEKLYGTARRVWLMDRGIPTEALLSEIRNTRPDTFYLVGTPRARVNNFEKHWLDLPWQQVRDAVEVKLFAKDGETYVLAKSEGRQAKEIAIRRKKLARLLRKIAGDAPELSQAGPVADARRRGENGSRPRVRVRETLLAEGWSGGHARDLHVCGRQDQAQGCRIPRRTLFVTD
jgi:transposase